MVTSHLADDADDSYWDGTHVDEGHAWAASHDQQLQGQGRHGQEAALGYDSSSAVQEYDHAGAGWHDGDSAAYPDGASYYGHDGELAAEDAGYAAGSMAGSGYAGDELQPMVNSGT